MSQKKEKKSKKKKSELEGFIMGLIEKSLKDTLKMAMQDLFKDFK